MNQPRAPLTLALAVAPLQHFGRDPRCALGHEVEALSRSSRQIDHPVAARRRRSGPIDNRDLDDTAVVLVRHAQDRPDWV